MLFSSLRPFAGRASTVLATVLLISGCEKPPAPPAQGPLPVQVVKATQDDVPVVGEWVAQTDGYINAQIQPQVSGYLIKQDYKEGSQVSKGQVLFEIDPRPLQATLDQAKGQLAQAKGTLGQQQAQLELAKINVQRDTPLAQAHAIAQSTLDTDTKTQQTDEAAVVSAQASIASAEAQVEAAELNLGFTKVRSLISGVAGQAQIQVGNLVSTSSVLTSVSQLNPIKVYFSISEQEYLSLSQRVKSGHGDLLNAGSAIPLKLTLTNNQVYPQTGRIIFVDRSVTAQTGSIRLAAEFANPGNLLRPGQFGRISAQTQVLQKAVVVPQRAVTELQGMNQVIVVGADNVAHVRTVKLGTQIKTEAGQSIVILSGVQAGDTVVTEGLDKVKDGMKVVPQTEPPTPPQNLNQSANQPAQNQQGS
jgi:membrane fusion protein (multidrug efflux system)